MIWLWAAKIKRWPSDSLAKIGSTSKCRFDLPGLSAERVCSTYNVLMNTLRSGWRRPSIGPRLCFYYRTAAELGRSLCTISRPRGDGFSRFVTWKLVGLTPTHHLRWCTDVIRRFVPMRVDAKRWGDGEDGIQALRYRLLRSSESITPLTIA